LFFHLFAYVLSFLKLRLIYAVTGLANAKPSVFSVRSVVKKYEIPKGFECAIKGFALSFYLTTEDTESTEKGLWLKNNPLEGIVRILFSGSWKRGSVPFGYPQFDHPDA
jgi:hypothetical protein